MGRIVSNFFISLDGVVESPDQWHFPYFDDAMGGAVGAAFATSDAMLMGRVLYEEWAGYWPDHADEPFGDVINPIQKYVVSNTLQSADWQNTDLLGADAADRLRELKESYGGDISMSGSATTVRWLLREGLLDELNLLVHPIAVGGGKARLFPADEPTVPLKLLSSEASTALKLSTGICVRRVTRAGMAVLWQWPLPANTMKRAFSPAWESQLDVVSAMVSSQTTCAAYMSSSLGLPAGIGCSDMAASK